jgi:hypothetical protein
MIVVNGVKTFLPMIAIGDTDYSRAITALSLSQAVRT